MHSLARKLMLLGLAIALPAAAQEFPSRPITLICPWPPGGSTDTHLRRFAEIATRTLGQTVVIENKPGGGGMIAPSSMARSARPDGYTLSQLPISAFRLPHIQKVSWDALGDFTYIIGLTGYTFGVVVKSDSPFKTFSDLLDYARANPGKLSYGSTGTGTSPHLLMEEVSMKTGVQFLHVPFKGNADSTQALLGGHIMAQSDSSGWGRFVDAGQFRLLVTFGKERTKHWPTVPTANDLGLDMVYSSPYGIVGPRGLEPRVVKILHNGFKKALDDPENLKVLDQLDQELWYQSSEDYAKYARETLQRERALIERLGLLAYNGSREGKSALLACAEIAAFAHSETHLLAVAGMPSSMFLTEGFLPEELLEEEKKRAQDVLNEGIAQLKKKGFAVAGHLAVGEPVEEISRLAAELKCDLIVVGHQQKASFGSRWWRGSVGKTLLDHAPCSIFVAQTRD